jgi:hypothetical protein
MSTDEEQYRRLYPDLAANGGILNWARNLLAQNPAIAVNGWGPNYAHIQSGTRSGQIYRGAEERRFSFDLWEEGKVLADGEHTNFQRVVQTIKDWVASTNSAEDFEREAGFVKARINHPRPNVKPGAYLVSGSTLKKI